MFKPLLFLLFLVALMACQPNAKDSSQTVLLQTATLRVALSPANAPVETPIHLQVDSSKPLRAITAEIQGISMYMGRIPLQWRQLPLTEMASESVWESTFFLGACSDPDMQWQLQLVLDYQDGERELRQLQFTSSWR